MSLTPGPSAPVPFQGCVLSPLLFSLYTNSCTSSHQSVKLQCGVHPLPGHHHLPGPQVGAKHHLPHQKGTSEDVLPAAAEEIQPAKGNDGALLHLHHRVHPHLLHHRLIRCCHCQCQRQTAE